VAKIANFHSRKPCPVHYAEKLQDERETDFHLFRLRTWHFLRIVGVTSTFVNVTNGKQKNPEEDKTLLKSQKRSMVGSIYRVAQKSKPISRIIIKSY